ncbi:MAG: glycoside hydrolase family 127 protein, partial [Fimbriimonadaceae bacterium]|nr:glycoside hydrolase family 127 protein [Fimbriimonadaceae bacterium]
MVAIACLAAMSASTAPLQPVPFTSVTIEDRFWSPRQRTNREVSVRHSFEMLEKAGNMVNLRLAAEGKREGYQGLLFTDSDLYKVIEGAAYTLATHPDPALDRRMDALIAEIAEAQMPDGYLNTWFQVTRPDQKWTNLRDHHELYCAGHLFEAAVAHHQATGKRNLLDIALKFADHIDRRFGPNGTHPGYAGHPEIELALVKLWKATGDDRWFRLARKLTEPRGAGFFADEHKTPRERYDGTYWLDDVPLAEHREIKGHAVRAAYLLAGVADIVRETGDPALTRMLDRVWRNATEKRIFVTGGIGP